MAQRKAISVPIHGHAVLICFAPSIETPTITHILFRPVQ